MAETTAILWGHKFTAFKNCRPCLYLESRSIIKIGCKRKLILTSEAECVRHDDSRSRPNGNQGNKLDFFIFLCFVIAEFLWEISIKTNLVGANSYQLLENFQIGTETKNSNSIKRHVFYLLTSFFDFLKNRDPLFFFQRAYIQMCNDQSPGVEQKKVLMHQLLNRQTHALAHP